jgi:hypothetical protein
MPGTVLTRVRVTCSAGTHGCPDVNSAPRLGTNQWALINEEAEALRVRPDCKGRASGFPAWCRHHQWQAPQILLARTPQKRIVFPTGSIWLRMPQLARLLHAARRQRSIGSRGPNIRFAVEGATAIGHRSPSCVVSRSRRRQPLSRWRPTETGCQWWQGPSPLRSTPVPRWCRRCKHTSQRSLDGYVLSVGSPCELPSLSDPLHRRAALKWSAGSASGRC